jgi:hypothetical protein
MGDKVMKKLFRIVIISLALVGSISATWTANAESETTFSADARQQDDRVVTYDAPVEGAISDSAFEERWTLEATSADFITVRAERLDGNLIPDITILDNNEQEVAWSYGADYTRAVAIIEGQELSSGVTYSIRVTREDGEDGLTAGAYRLTVTPLGVGADHTNNTTVIGTVIYDTPVTGAISNTHWLHRYTLMGEAGDWLQVTARRTDGTLVPVVELVDNNGQTISTGYPDQTGVFGQVESYDLPYSGDYEVWVYRERQIDGVTNGGYELTVTLLGSGEESERLTSRQPQIIQQYNAAQSGQITNALWYEDWQFRTEAGDTVTITAWRSPAYASETPNMLQPHIWLLDANGSELQRAYVDATLDRATIERYTFDGAGTYTIRVMRENQQSGYTTGTYDLLVILDGAGEGSPLLAGEPQVIEAGAIVTDSLDNVKWRDEWTFNANDDDIVTLIATRADGTLVPRLELLDSNGISLYSVYAEYTEDIARLEEYQLPYTGAYTVVVFRDGWQEGYTSGGYTLEMQLTPAQ